MKAAVNRTIATDAGNDVTIAVNQIIGSHAAGQIIIRTDRTGGRRVSDIVNLYHIRHCPKPPVQCGNNRRTADSGQEYSVKRIENRKHPVFLPGINHRHENQIGVDSHHHTLQSIENFQINGSGPGERIPADPGEPECACTLRNGGDIYNTAPPLLLDDNAEPAELHESLTDSNARNTGLRSQLRFRRQRRSIRINAVLNISGNPSRQLFIFRKRTHLLSFSKQYK